MSQLRSWAQRARILSDYADKNDIVIVRYEDMKRNFDGVVDALFVLLDLPVSRTQLQEIHRVTDFATVTSVKASRPGNRAHRSQGCDRRVVIRADRPGCQVGLALGR